MEAQNLYIKLILKPSNTYNRYHDTQHNDIQHNDTQHNDTSIMGLFATLSINDTQHNRISAIMMSVVMPNVIMLSVMAPYNKPCFETAYIGENAMDLLKQRVAQYGAISISLGYCIFTKKIITSLQK